MGSRGRRDEGGGGPAHLGPPRRSTAHVGVPAPPPALPPPPRSLWSPHYPHILYNPTNPPLLCPASLQSSFLTPSSRHVPLSRLFGPAPTMISSFTGLSNDPQPKTPIFPTRPRRPQSHRLGSPQSSSPRPSSPAQVFLAPPPRSLFSSVTTPRTEVYSRSGDPLSHGPHRVLGHPGPALHKSRTSHPALENPSARTCLQGYSVGFLFVPALRTFILQALDPRVQSSQIHSRRPQDLPRSFALHLHGPSKTQVLSPEPSTRPPQPKPPRFHAQSCFPSSGPKARILPHLSSSLSSPMSLSPPLPPSQPNSWHSIFSPLPGTPTAGLCIHHVGTSRLGPSSHPFPLLSAAPKCPVSLSPHPTMPGASPGPGKSRSCPTRMGTCELSSLNIPQSLTTTGSLHTDSQQASTSPD